MHWMVMTPEFEYVEPILDDGSGPTEIARDVCYVEARTKREAIIAGVKKMRSKDYHPYYKSYYDWYWDESTNPYTGVKAESAECEHGFCYCENLPCDKKMGEDICPKCELEWKQSCKHEMHEGLLQTQSQTEPTIQEYCWNCMSTKEEIERWKSESLK